MKVAYKDSLRYKLEQRINSLPHNVILRSDLADLGGKRQISAAIKQLIEEKKIARVGYGLYAKTEPSPFSDSVLLKGLGGFTAMVQEALNRLEVLWEQSEAEEAYNSGRSTQVPAQSILRLKTRFRRRISYKGMLFKFKRAN